ncbi:hypothetical protein RJ639_007512, partial [Escallonia herrerae]
SSGGSDTDTNPDESPEYYQPISAGGEGDGNLSDRSSHDDRDSDFHGLPNGHAENGISALDLSDGDGEEEEEEFRTREAADTAVLRAFSADESRRNAPLAPENAARVMEAMRGISFGGVAPDWAERVPEDRWLDQVRRLRRQPASATATVATQD